MAGPSRERRQTQQALIALTNVIQTLVGEIQQSNRQQQAEAARDTAAQPGGRPQRRTTTSRQQREAAAVERRAARTSQRQGAFNARFAGAQIGARGAVTGISGGGRLGAGIWAAGMAGRKIGEIATGITEPLRARSVSAEIFDSLAPGLIQNLTGFAEAKAQDKMTLGPVMQAIASADAAGVPLETNEIKRGYDFSAARAERVFGQYKELGDYGKGRSEQSKITTLGQEAPGAMTKGEWMGSPSDLYALLHKWMGVADDLKDAAAAQKSAAGSAGPSGPGPRTMPARNE